MGGTPCTVLVPSVLVLPITDWSGDRVPRERLDCRVVPVTASARRQLWLLKRSSFTSIDIQNAVSKMRLLCEIVSMSLTTIAAKAWLDNDYEPS